MCDSSSDSSASPMKLPNLELSIFLLLTYFGSFHSSYRSSIIAVALNKLTGPRAVMTWEFLALNVSKIDMRLNCGSTAQRHRAGSIVTTTHLWCQQLACHEVHTRSRYPSLPPGFQTWIDGGFSKPQKCSALTPEVNPCYTVHSRLKVGFHHKGVSIPGGGVYRIAEISLRYARSVTGKCTLGGECTVGNLGAYTTEITW